MGQQTTPDIDVVVAITAGDLERQIRTGFGSGGLPRFVSGSASHSLASLLPAGSAPPAASGIMVTIGVAFDFGYPDLDLTPPNGTANLVTLELPFRDASLFFHDLPRTLLSGTPCEGIPDQICGLGGTLALSAPLVVTPLPDDPAEGDDITQTLQLAVDSPAFAVDLRLDSADVSRVNTAFSPCPLTWAQIQPRVEDGIDQMLRTDGGLLPGLPIPVRPASTEPTDVKEICEPEIVTDGRDYVLLPVRLAQGCPDGSVAAVTDQIEATDRTAVLVDPDFLLSEMIRPTYAASVLGDVVPNPPGVTPEVVDEYFDRPLRLMKQFRLFEREDPDTGDPTNFLHAHIDVVGIHGEVENGRVEVTLTIDGAAGVGPGNDIIITGSQITTIHFEQARGRLVIRVCQREPDLSTSMTIGGFFKLVLLSYVAGAIVPLLGSIVAAMMAAVAGSLAVQLGGGNVAESQFDDHLDLEQGRLDAIDRDSVTVQGREYARTPETTVGDVEPGDEVVVTFSREVGTRTAVSVEATAGAGIAAITNLLLVERTELDDLVLGGELRLVETGSIQLESELPRASRWSIDLDPPRTRGGFDDPIVSDRALFHAEVRWALGDAIEPYNGAEIADLGVHSVWKARNVGQVDVRTAAGYGPNAVPESDIPSLGGPPPPTDPCDPLPELEFDARVLGLRSSTGRFARLILWRDDVDRVRGEVRVYTQPDRFLAITRNWTRSPCQNPRAGVEEGMVPILVGTPSSGFGFEMQPRSFRYQDCQYTFTGEFTAEPHGLVDPLEYRWWIELSDGTTVDLEASAGETEVQVNGATVTFEVRGQNGEVCHVETSLGSDGDFTLHLEAIERACHTHRAETRVTWEGAGREEGEKLAALDDLRRLVDIIATIGRRPRTPGGSPPGGAQPDPAPEILVAGEILVGGLRDRTLSPSARPTPLQLAAAGALSLASSGERRKVATTLSTAIHRIRSGEPESAS